MYCFSVVLCLVGCATILGSCKRPDKAKEQPEAAVALPPPIKVETVEAPKTQPKHLLLITVDTLRADALGVYGGKAHTPHMDELAGRGFTFLRCIANAMLTNPSHASIMTSLFPRDHAVYDNQSGIADEHVTLAELLQQNGYKTGAVIGFPHLNPNVSNLGQGFQHIERGVDKGRSAVATTALALKTLDRVREGHEGPVFLWVHYTDPHAPYEPEVPPLEADKPTKRATKRKPLHEAMRVSPRFQRTNEWFLKLVNSNRTLEDVRALYRAEVEGVDRALGVLWEGLNAREMRETTAIVLSADHGENLGEHNLYFHHGGLYDEVVHVPLIVSIPWLQVPVRTSASLVQSVDIAPTLLELADIAPPQSMRGHSLRSLMEGQAPTHTLAFSEHMYRQLIAVRDSHSTLILHRQSSAQFPSYRFVAGRREFYQYHYEPGASGQSIREAQPATPKGKDYQRLTKSLARYLSDARGKTSNAKPGTGQDRESLRALGYVE